MTLESMFVSFDTDSEGRRSNNLEYVSDIGHLTPAERWDSIRKIKNEELRYQAAYKVPRLTPPQRWYLVQGIKNECLRYGAACDVPRLTPEQRWNLVRGIKDEGLRYKAARDVPRLTSVQRRKLGRGIKPEVIEEVKSRARSLEQRMSRFSKRDRDSYKPYLRYLSCQPPELQHEWFVLATDGEG